MDLCLHRCPRTDTTPTSARLFCIFFQGAFFLPPDSTPEGLPVRSLFGQDRAQLTFNCPMDPPIGHLREE